MDEHRDFPEAGGPPPESHQDRPSSTERLVSRLAELRGQLDVLAPQDQEKGREALERIRQDQERIATLEELLAGARTREHDLTAQAVRDRLRILEHEARISELSAIAARVAAAEAARDDAESTAAEMRRTAELADARWESAQAEIETLRARTTELETDLVSVADELAAAAIARAEAARLAEERNGAQERARLERRLAAEDRIRAADANVRATELQRQLRAAERRIVQITNESRAAEPSRDAPEPASTPPWIELQRTTSEAQAEEAAAPSSPSLWGAPEQTSLKTPRLGRAVAEEPSETPATPPASGLGSDDGSDVVDLTAAEESPTVPEPEPETSAVGNGTAASTPEPGPEDGGVTLSSNERLRRFLRDREQG